MSALDLGDLRDVRVESRPGGSFVVMADIGPDETFPADLGWTCRVSRKGRSYFASASIGLVWAEHVQLVGRGETGVGAADRCLIAFEIAVKAWKP